jgi:hypothetical protein
MNEIGVAFAASGLAVIRGGEVPDRRLCAAMCLPAGVFGNRAESFMIRTAKSISRFSNWSLFDRELLPVVSSCIRHLLIRRFLTGIFYSLSSMTNLKWKIEYGKCFSILFALPFADDDLISLKVNVFDA